ncbi:S phase cyclin a-associated protein in the endoplasmic reticulum domain-containing protein [Ditylenchus destructor]|uniref:S phase cyclin a-associated protein in the endoplasmic reticulum domain-containing protein n=1 Tax=Ditylenchus destructor TaxID=166010 RepID=A0AAD4NLN1_9BILA|nr:S phase cyclin a-associated protein in the endoplasmic reticulum domain-containing protein [Ditylenchus destructor]
MAKTVAAKPSSASNNGAPKQPGNNTMLNKETSGKQSQLYLVMQEAKEWSKCVESLKAAVDSMYEICRIRQNIFGCEEALIYLQNAIKEFTSLQAAIRIEMDWENSEKEESVWQLVTSRAKRRKSSNASSGSEKAENRTPQKSGAIEETARISNREAYGKKVQRAAQSEEQTPYSGESQTNSKQSQRNCPSLSCISVTGGRIMAPRSAMDLPQTRASMAKMAYSRQLLWQQRKKQLAEKLLTRQRHEQALEYNRRRRSLPALAQRCVGKPIQASSGGDGRTSRNSGSTASNKRDTATKHSCGNTGAINSGREIQVLNGAVSITNLESINESAEEEANANFDKYISEDNSSTHTMAGGGPGNRLAPSFPQMTRSEPPNYGLDLADDEEWRAMTEEEESLAQEEESLKKEIEEEESVSIDDEVHRRTSVERSFDIDFEDEGNVDYSATTRSDFPLTPPNAVLRPRWKEVVAKWAVKPIENEIRKCTNATEKQADKEEKIPEKVPDTQNTETIRSFSPQHYRRPGELAQFRAKLLSPSRKKASDERRLEDRQQKAEELRLQLQEDKANRLRDLHVKVGEVRGKREEILEKKRLHLENLKEKMKKAENNRQNHISDIVHRSKEENQKIMEIAFINTLEAENIKYGMSGYQARESDRIQQRIDSIAKERAFKMEQKAAKEAAAEERRRIADEQRTEKLKETSIRKKEKLELAEAQRNEQAERYRNRGRQREQLREQRKAAEVTDSRILLSKIQEKHNISVRRYEETLEQKASKALEMCSPRQLQSWVTLADFSQLPSDVDYTEIRRKCTLCDLELFNDLQLISHICSDLHFEKCVITNDEAQELLANYEYLKSQLEHMIKDIEDEVLMKASSSVHNDETNNGCELKENVKPRDEPLKCSVALKKRKAKIKQRLLKANSKEPEFDSAVNFSSESTLTLPENHKRPEKKVKELLTLLNSKELCDSQRTSMERAVSELCRTFMQLPKSDKAKAAHDFYDHNVPESMINYLLDNCSNNSQSSQRMFSKSVYFLFLLLSENRHIAEILFHSKFLVQLCDLFNHKMSIITTLNSANLHSVQQSVLTLYLIDTLVCSSKDHSQQERVLQLAQYLVLSDLPKLLRLIMDKVTGNKETNIFEDVTPKDLVKSSSKNHVPKASTKRPTKSSDPLTADWLHMELSKDISLNALQVAVELVSNLIVHSNKANSGLNSSSTRNNSPHRRPSSCDLPKHESVACLVITIIHSVILCLYSHFLQTQQQQSSSSIVVPTSRTDPMNTSFIYSGSVSIVSMDNKSDTVNNSSMTTSTISSNSKTAAPNKSTVISHHSVALALSSSSVVSTRFPPISSQTFEQLSGSLLFLWNRVCSSDNSEHITEAIFKVDDCIALRLNHLFQCIVSHCVKEISNSAELSQERRLLAQAIHAVGYFASISRKTQLMCILGWQRSLVMQLCTSIPFDYIQRAELRSVLMPTLISILYNNLPGVNIIRNEFDLNWLITYLKEAMSDGCNSNNTNYFAFSKMLNPDRWQNALQFFECQIGENRA